MPGVCNGLPEPFFTCALSSHLAPHALICVRDDNIRLQYVVLSGVNIKL